MGLKRVILRELRRIWHSPRYLIILTASIAFMFVMFATMTKEGQPQKLSIAIVDMDGTYLSRRFCHELDATPGVKICAVYDNHTEARKAMQSGKIFAFYEIPNGTYNDVLQFRSPHLTLYVNSVYMLAGTLCYKQLATMGMLATGAVQREVLRKKGYGEEQIMGLIQPVEFDSRAIGNPWTNYSNYLMTTFIPAIIAFIVLMHTAYVISRERHERSLRGWLRHANGSAFVALVGKLLPYTAWYSLLCLLANLIMFGFMGFPLQGSWLLLALTSILLVTASQCIGAFIACALPDPPMAMGISGIFSAMSFSLSGFSFPVESMPTIFTPISWLYPIRHYYLNFCDIAIFGNGIGHCWPRLCALLAFALLIFVAASFLQWQIKRDERASVQPPIPQQAKATTL